MTKTYRGGAQAFKQAEYTNSSYELELHQKRLDALQFGGSNKKTKRKKQQIKDKIRKVYSRLRSKKRRHTRKKHNEQHGR